MKIEIYSKNGEWLGKPGLFRFDKPLFTAEYRNNVLYMKGKKVLTDYPLKFIQKLASKNSLYVVGYISYDYKRKIFPEEIKKKSSIGLPMMFFGFFKNYKEGKIVKSSYHSVVKSIKINTNKEKFLDKVNKAKKYIESGDIYQINLAHRIEIDGFFNTDKIFQNLIFFNQLIF